MKTINLTSPIKIITSGNVPTIADISKGEIAFGLFGAQKRWFVNLDGLGVEEFTPPAQVISVTDTTYNAADAELSIVYSDGNTSVINLPKENFLSNAVFNPTTNILTLTLVDGTDVPVDMSDLVDVYTASALGGLELNTNAFGIKAGGVLETMLDTAVVAKLNAALTVLNGNVEAGKYISGATVNANGELVLDKADSGDIPIASGTGHVNLSGTLDSVVGLLTTSAVNPGGGLILGASGLELDEANISVVLVTEDI